MDKAKERLGLCEVIRACRMLKERATFSDPTCIDELVGEAVMAGVVCCQCDPYCRTFTNFPVSADSLAARHVYTLCMPIPIGVRDAPLPLMISMKS